MFDYEKLGSFYLGREYDLNNRETKADFVMYDAKDLTTHAVIVGMTGSGKTGLGFTLLEEAAIDGIPALIIDPKGDMANLALRFPKLNGTDFQPWIDQDAAARQGMTVAEFAEDRAELWKEGLAKWDQSPDRIQRLCDAADVVVYTPGSNIGIPISVFKSLDAPSPEARSQPDAVRERISTTVSGLLALLGIDADPIRSREHILLSNILDAEWRAGRNLDLPSLIRAIQSPPFSKIGIMDLETIFPAKDRTELAMTINNVLASPAFAAWTQGKPLNIQKLLYSDSGKPQLAVLSIAHLSDQERMFFVTLLLNEVVSWVRAQPGTSSLRALLYMDEVFGYLPPTANPPSKTPMLTLLKQARAYGLGLVLSTQNPVDLDYKALSNAGTWFLGRLQTERDQLRVLDGLQSANASSGVEFDRDRLQQILSGVGSRVFLLNNVHEDHPVIFHTRWALSYLSGPMTRAQIAQLTAEQSAHLVQNIPMPPANITPMSQDTQQNPQTIGGDPPVLPTDVAQRYVPVSARTPQGVTIVYQPALLGQASLHYVDSKAEIDCWKDARCVIALDTDEEIGRDPWENAEWIESEIKTESAPERHARFLDAPAEILRKGSYRTWGASLKSTLYRDHNLTLHYSPDLKLYSNADEREGDFIARIRHNAREQRDLEIAKLRKKYASKFDTLESRKRTAEAAVDREADQAKSATLSAAVSIGSSLLGALFGRKKLSATNVSRAGTSIRSMSRAADQRGDISRAQEKVESIEDDIKELEEELEAACTKIQENYSDERLEVEPYEIQPRKSDLSVSPVSVLWIPCYIGNRSDLVPATELFDNSQD